MGIGVEVSCPNCGSFTLPLGRGMRRPNRCVFPFMCRACRYESNLDIYAEELRCSNCSGNDVVPYGHPAVVREHGTTIVFQCEGTPRFSADILTLTNGKYWCPGCEQFTASFGDSGIRWD
jgi:hypothetical protein